MITTDRKELAERAQKVRNHGMVDRDTHYYLGYNYRMSEINAAIGLVQLKKLETLNNIRIQNSHYILESVKDIPWLEIPHIEKGVKHVFFWCPVRVKEDILGMKTEELVRKLREKGVEVRQRYKNPLYRQEILLNQMAYPKKCPFSCPYYGKNIDYSSVYLPVAEKVAGTVIGLPNHPALTGKEREMIVEVLHSIEREVNL